MNLIDPLDRVARRLILPLNDKLIDVEVFKSNMRRDTYVVQFIMSEFIPSKDREEYILEMHNLFKMLSPKKHERIHVSFAYG